MGVASAWRPDSRPAPHIAVVWLRVNDLPQLSEYLFPDVKQMVFCLKHLIRAVNQSIKWAQGPLTRIKYQDAGQ